MIAPRRARPAPRGEDPLPRPAQLGARVPRLPHRRRARPHVVRRFRGEGNERRLARRGGDRRRPHRSRARRRLRVHRQRARQARATSPWRRRRSRPPELARPGTGVSVAQLHARRARSAWCPPARWPCCASGPFDRRFEFVALAPGRSRADPSRRAGRRAAAGAGSRPTRRPACTWCGCAPAASAPSGRSRSRACRSRKRAAERPRPLVVLPAISWQGLNPVDDDFDGFADSLPEGALARPRAAVRRRRPAGRLQLRGRAAAALPRPRAAPLRPDHRPLAGPRRGPRARERARGWRSRAARCGCPSRC